MLACCAQLCEGQAWLLGSGKHVQLGKALAGACCLVLATARLTCAAFLPPLGVAEALAMKA